MILLLLTACGLPPAGTTDSATDTAADTAADTATPTDLDGDGYSVADGDCDDTNAAISPGAPEVAGDEIDDNCDGSLLVTVDPRALAVRLEGTGEAGFGAVLLAVPATETEAGGLLVTESGYQVGEEAAVSMVYLFSAGEAVAGEPAHAQLWMEDGESSYVGRSLGSTLLGDGQRVWLTTLTEISTYGGLCAWLDEGPGLRDILDADACMPPFERNVTDRLDASILSDQDIDGDGVADLVMGGTSGEERLGVLYLYAGPLTRAQLSEPPTRSALSLLGAAHPFDAGDMDGDGYEDLAIANPQANTPLPSAGVVYLLPGGVSLPAETAGLAAIEGDREGLNWGAEVAPVDFDGDGHPSLCVSAPSSSAAGSQSGEVGCFEGPFTGVRSAGDAAYVWTGEAARAGLGQSLAVARLSSGAEETLIVSAQNKVYLLSPGAEPVVWAGDIGGLFGASLSVADLTGDGRDDLIVGEPEWDERGAVYVFDAASGAW